MESETGEEMSEGDGAMKDDEVREMVDEKEDEEEDEEEEEDEGRDVFCSTIFEVA